MQSPWVRDLLYITHPDLWVIGDPILEVGSRWPRGSGCTLPRLLGWDLQLEDPCLCTHYTVKIPSHSKSSKKSRPLWSVMMETVHQHTSEGNSLKPTKKKKVLPHKGLWLLKYTERPTPNMIKKKKS